MNIHPIKSMVFAALVMSTGIYSTITLPRNYLNELIKSRQFQTAQSACAQGCSYITNFVKDYAIPYTIAGASYTKKFFENYAIPYTITGATYTKNAIKDYVIPGIISVSKTGYASAQKLYDSLVEAHRQSNTDIANHQLAAQEMPTHPILVQPVIDIPDQPVIVTPELTATPMEECGICKEPIIDNGVTLKPCNHHEICGKCAQENFVTHKRTTCPFCNQNVEEIIPTSSDVINQEECLKKPTEEECTCCVCLEPFNNNRVKLVPCGHDLFCRSCIDNNFSHGRTICPYCNQKVEKILNMPEA